MRRERSRSERARDVFVMPLVSSVTVTSVKATVIGGTHSGWKEAVTDRVKSALPFCTGKSPSAETLSLFTAFGWWPPGLMHSAVAVRTTWICSSSPSPASLPDTVRVVPSDEIEKALFTKCGLPANAGGAPSAERRSVAKIKAMNLRIAVSFFPLHWLMRESCQTLWVVSSEDVPARPMCIGGARAFGRVDSATTT